MKRVYPGIFTDTEVTELTDRIDENPDNRGFGVRHFLRDNPAVRALLFSHPGFTHLLGSCCEQPTVIKSLYFDKPPKANWSVNWHQDITVNLSEEYRDDARFRNQRVLADRVVVQPNPELLRAIYTFRIHLDAADVHNGCLAVIEGSETEGVVRIDEEYLSARADRVTRVEVGRGDVMAMRPLTVHSSRKVVVAGRRRVVHLEVVEAGVVDRLPLIERFCCFP